jgi:hypothetical protein
VPDERENLTSVRYWQTPAERVPQRFYVAFCLLMSSVQDSILGQKERESNNLNWSATFSYYSLVHGGRLLCFLALGDYPTSHAELRRLFSPRLTERRRTGRNGYPFDWLRGFATPPHGQPGQALPEEGGTAAEFRQMIAAYLNQVHVADVEQRMSQLGEVLEAAAPLRNDSNYEALLIAHEYQHVSISQAFDKLSLHMGAAAETTTPFLIDAFNGFRLHDPDLPETREQYQAFLHEYVRGRIGDAIRRKLGGSGSLETKLEEVLVRIGTRSAVAQYDQLEKQVSMALFEGKARLMGDFQNRIENLVGVTRA